MKAERVTNKLHAQLLHFLACILTLKVFTFWLLKVALFPNISLFFSYSAINITSKTCHHDVCVCGNVGFSDGNIPVCMQIHNNACRFCPCRRLRRER